MGQPCSSLEAVDRAGPLLASGGRPIYLAGRPDDQALGDLLEANPPAQDGYSCPLFVIDPEANAGAGLSKSSIVRESIESGRIQVLGGAVAIDSFRLTLDDRLHLAIDGPVVACNKRVSLAREIGQVLDRAKQRQKLELDRSLRANRAWLAGCDEAFWARRFGEPIEPLRILIPTTRHSTYVRYAAQDLGGAFEELGALVRVLEEPNPFERLTTLAYARAVEELRPDLVVLINYTRAHLAPGLPEGLPSVCWIQDAMGHLFDARLGAAQGPLDFVTGHLHRSLFRDFGYRRERAMYLPVLASDRKFHSGPLERNRRTRFKCEIACVTNHSQTPEALRAQLLDGAGGNPIFQSVIDELIGEARRLIAIINREPFAEPMRRAIINALRTRNLAQDEAQVSMLQHQVCEPIGDRLIRHETLEWAAQLAGDRGWRLKIFGHGWERHPTLATFAEGPVEHGEELRASYQSATVHLHASINWNLHQRVMECALSGGLPLCRRKHSDLELLACDARARAIDQRRAHADAPLTRPIEVMEHPAVMALVAQLQRLEPGTLARHSANPQCLGSLAVTPALARDPWAFMGNRPAPREMIWLQGDLAETSFATRLELEALLDRALERPNWRLRISTGIASRSRRHLTYEIAAKRLVEFIRDHLLEQCTESRLACA